MGFWSDFVRLLRVGRKSPLVPLVFLFVGDLYRKQHLSLPHVVIAGLFSIWDNHNPTAQRLLGPRSQRRIFTPVCLSHILERVCLGWILFRLVLAE